jgi:DNA-binding IclR family transcriptional regulator
MIINQKLLTVAATLKVLRYLATSEGHVDIRSTAQNLGITTSSTKRILRTLVDEDFATTSTDTLHYYLGPQAFQLSAAIKKAMPMGRVAQPILHELADKTGESVSLNVFQPNTGYALCVGFAESTRPLQYVIEIGEKKLLHVGASGKTILAFLPELQRNEVLRKNPPEKFDPSSDFTKKMLRQLATVRKQGYCITKGERLPGAVGIGVPIFDSENTVTASLLVTIPTGYFRVSDKARLVRILKKYSLLLSKKLGSS